VTNPCACQFLGFYFNVVKAVVRNKICKALIKPKIVPPFHSNEVAKPVMREFMRNYYSQPGVFASIHLFSKQELIIEGNKRRVFHRTKVKLRTVNLIVFAKGIGIAKEALVKYHCLIRYLINEFFELF